jgi:hypothetical protein
MINQGSWERTASVKPRLTVDLMAKVNAKTAMVNTKSLPRLSFPVVV